VIRRLPSATGGWRGFYQTTTKHPFFNTKYHTTEESAKSMTKANVGEAPRSEATQRYPQLFNEESKRRTNKNLRQKFTMYF